MLGLRSPGLTDELLAKLANLPPEIARFGEPVDEPTVVLVEHDGPPVLVGRSGHPLVPPRAVSKPNLAWLCLQQSPRPLQPHAPPDALHQAAERTALLGGEPLEPAQ